VEPTDIRLVSARNPAHEADDGELADQTDGLTAWFGDNAAGVVANQMNPNGG